jgi:hypothetical protein
MIGGGNYFVVAVNPQVRPKPPPPIHVTKYKILTLITNTNKQFPPANYTYLPTSGSLNEKSEDSHRTSSI